MYIHLGRRYATYTHILYIREYKLFTCIGVVYIHVYNILCSVQCWPALCVHPGARWIYTVDPGARWLGESILNRLSYSMLSAFDIKLQLYVTQCEYTLYNVYCIVYSLVIHYTVYSIHIVIIPYIVDVCTMKI